MVNILQKFDDEGLEIPAGTTDYLRYRVTNPATKIKNMKTLFAAKPDNQGWESDNDMVAAREENLSYFNSIDELNAASYTCVAVLYEVRDSQIYLGAGDNLR